ncbi:MAG: TRL-like family protein [Nitrospirae bacterium]|nr:TRL-like family protein [Nitrospirota bacterium]MCL5284251.1 TRL-like family protein [Nitrospirota bacterium]
MKKTFRLVPVVLLSAAVLGGCTLAMPEAPMDPMVDAKKPAGLKSTEVCNGTFAADTETGSGDTILDAARKAGIKKIVSIQYETKNYIFFTRFCAVVKGT